MIVQFGIWSELDDLARAWADMDCRLCRGTGVVDLTSLMCPCVERIVWVDNSFPGRNQ